MWNCSRCGEAIKDNFDACWRCGTRRDGTASEELQEEGDDRSASTPEPEPLDPDEARVDEPTPPAPPERPLTQENLAALLLRFLGLCLSVFGIASVVSVVGRLLLESNRYGLDDFVRHSYAFESLIAPAMELLIGLYFLIGGQWVYNRILVPVRRTFPDDESWEAEDDGPWRTWKSVDGAYTVKAKFVRVARGMVYLLKEDGSTITVDRSVLSQDDWDWVTHQGGSGKT
jgi:hypothetical protein